MRFYKFNSWYENNENREKYTKLNEYLNSFDENDNQVIHFTSLIFQNENPNKIKLQLAYYSLIENLKNK